VPVRLKMKHLRKVTALRADALGDFIDAVERAWSDLVYAVKNDVAL